MEFVRLSIQEGIAEVRLERGKVNALDDHLVGELSVTFRELADDPRVRAAILTGTGKFFGYSEDAFAGYLGRFTELYRELYAHPKPVVAALNGHAVAGGCMLATA